MGKVKKFPPLPLTRNMSSKCFISNNPAVGRCTLESDQDRLIRLDKMILFHGIDGSPIYNHEKSHLGRFLSVETKKEARWNMLRRSSRYLWLGDKISRGCPWMPPGSKSENWRFEKSSRNDALQGLVAKLKDLPRSTDGHHEASHFETGSFHKWLVLQGPFCWILLNHIREHDSKQWQATCKSLMPP